MDGSRAEDLATCQNFDDDIFHGVQQSPDLDFLGGHPHNQSVEDYIEELLNGTLACTHTHVCNPPGPDQKHTHSCQHTHTRLLTPPVLPAESEAEDQKSSGKESEVTGGRKRKAIPTANNREAVRKYRERKKARTEYLEGEVARLQSINGQLVKSLQGQTAMAAELHRLRGILSDLQRMLNREMAAPSALGGLMDPAPMVSAAIGAPLSPPDFFTTSVEVPCHQDIGCLHQPYSNKRLHAPGARRPEDSPGTMAHADLALGMATLATQAMPSVIRGRACKPDG